MAIYGKGATEIKCLHFSDTGGI